MRIVSAARSLVARWDIPAVDAALALAFTLAATSLYATTQWGDPRGAFTLLATVPLLLRRRRPSLAFLTQFVGVVLALPDNNVATIGALVIGAYSLGMHSQRWWLPVPAACLAAAVIGIPLAHGNRYQVPDLLVPFIVLVPATLVGSAVRVPTLRAEAMRERSLRLEQEREAAAAQAAAAERARIARDLHDVVAHAVSVMVVQTVAAREMLRRTPETADQSLGAVESTGRQALTELRHMLELLHEDKDELDLAPQPGLAQIASLVERVSAAGQPVQLRVTGAARPLPEGIELAVYRIAQEALTNALKHAHGAPTEVVVDYGTEYIAIDVVDEGEVELPGAHQSAGRGLLGMRERVAMYGGEFSAKARSGRGFAVRARLPLETV